MYARCRLVKMIDSRSSVGSIADHLQFDGRSLADWGKITCPCINKPSRPHARCSARFAWNWLAQRLKGADRAATSAANVPAPTTTPLITHTLTNVHSFFSFSLPCIFIIFRSHHKLCARSSFRTVAPWSLIVVVACALSRSASVQRALTCLLSYLCANAKRVSRAIDQPFDPVQAQRSAKL